MANFSQIWSFLLYWFFPSCSRHLVPPKNTTFGPLVGSLSIPCALSCVLRPVFQKKWFAITLPFPILALKTIAYFIELSHVKIRKDILFEYRDFFFLLFYVLFKLSFGKHTHTFFIKHLQYFAKFCCYLSLCCYACFLLECFKEFPDIMTLQL